MKVSDVTGSKNSQTVWVEPGPETFPVKRGLDLTPFKGKDVKALFVNGNKVVVGVERNNGTVYGERS